MTWIIFTCGMVIGASVGLFIAALCAVAGDADNRIQK